MPSGTHRRFAVARLVGVLALLAAPATANALICTNTVTTNWSVAGNWSCGRVPLNVDDVFIANNTTVTVNIAGAVAGSLTINGGANATTLTFGVVGTSLTVTNAGGLSGNVVVSAPTGNVAKQITVGARSLTVTGNVTINGGTAGSGAGNISQLTATSGTVAIGGNLIVSAGTVATNVARVTLTSGTITVGGNATLTGGAAATRDALLSVSTGLITINGGLTVSATVATSSTAQITAAAGRIDVNGAAGVLNEDRVTVGPGTFSVTNAAATFTNSDAAVTVLTSVSTGLLSVAGNFSNAAGEFVLITGAAGRVTVLGTLTNNGTVITGTGTVNAGTLVNNNAVTVSTGLVNVTGAYTNTAAGDTITISGAGGRLTVGGTLTNNGTITISTTGIVNANGTFTNSGTFTNTAAGTLNLRGATATINGTFNRGTGTVVGNAGAGQALSGTAITGPVTGLNNLTINNANGVTIGNDITVHGTLTFTSGKITTGGNMLVMSATAAAVSGASSSNYVFGNMRKVFSAAGAYTLTIGDGSIYAPVGLAVTGAGNIAANTTAGDHPQVASSGFDPDLTANRYWTLTSTAIPPSYDATFNFVGGDLDPDTAPTSTNWVVKRYLGAWFTPTTGTRTGTSTQATGLTAVGDFALGELYFTVGDFSAFENSTPGGSIAGVIKTKIAGSSFNLDLVAIQAGAVMTGFKGKVKVELVDASSGACGTFANIQTLGTNPQFMASDNGRKANVAFQENNSYPDARVRITYPATGTAIAVGCSTDNFAIRPNDLLINSVTDGTWETAGTSRNLTNTADTGGVIHKAGRPFTISVTARNSLPATTTNYAGSPDSATLTQCGGTGCPATFGTLSPGTWSADPGPVPNGNIITNTAAYSDVGAFTLKLVDANFANVDSGDSSTAERYIESNTFDVGRFVPNHFSVSLNTPQFTTQCVTGTFTYVGQLFNFGTAPLITVTAKDFAGNTTANYAGTLWKITNSTLTGRAYEPAASLDLGNVPPPASDPAIVISGGGSGTLTFSIGSGIAFARSTPVAPFDGEISLAINIIDGENIVYENPIGTPANPAQFGATTPGNGIAFGAGKEMRFGRLRMQNALGSEKLVLPVPIETQYWRTTPSPSTFLRNTNDSCTTLAAGDVGLSDYRLNLDSGETTINQATISFTNGLGTLTLSPPGTGNNGSVLLTPDLAAAARTYLQGAWTASAYDDNPSARATFGLFGGQPQNFIYFRENY